MKIDMSRSHYYKLYLVCFITFLTNTIAMHFERCSMGKKL